MLQPKGKTMNRPVQLFRWSNRSLNSGEKRRQKHVFILTLLAGAVPVHAATPAQSLHSPWDGDPVPMTGSGIHMPCNRASCSRFCDRRLLRLDDPTHSIIDPVRQEAYRKSSDGVKAVGMAVVKAADDYRTTGSLRRPNVRWRRF